MSLLDKLGIVLCCDTADINSTGITGDYINMAKCLEVLFLVFYGDGTAAHDVNVTLYEATTSAGGSAQVLAKLGTGDIFTMKAASYATYAALAAGWTKETQATDGSAFTDDDTGESVGISAFRVRRDELSDGFDYVRLDVADPTASKIVGMIAIGELVDQQAPAEQINIMV